MVNFISFLIAGLLGGNAFVIAENTNESNSTKTTYQQNMLQNLDALVDKVEEPVRAFSRSYEPDPNLKRTTVADAKVFVRYAGASYCDKQPIETWTCTHCAKTNRLEEIFWFADEATDAQGYLAVNRNRQEIILSFRGSSFLANWIQNLKFSLVPASFDGKNSYNVHSGFKECSENLMKIYKNKLQSLIAKNPGYKLVLTGHSLGGAISVLSSLYLKNQLNIPSNKLEVATFGCPRIGDQEFARYLNQHDFTLTRFVNENDVVPHFPTQYNGYSHHHYETWYYDGKDIICKTNSLEDEDCSLSYWYWPSTKAHLKIWDVPLGSDACKA